MASSDSITLRNDTAELERLAGFLEGFAEQNGVPQDVLFKLNLALDELVTNVASYAWEDAADHSMTVTLTIADGALTAELDDDGKPFDPLHDAREPDLDAGIEDRAIGGLGIHLVIEMMDSVDYRRENDLNRVRLVKRLGEAT